MNAIAMPTVKIGADLGVGLQRLKGLGGAAVAYGNLDAEFQQTGPDFGIV
jgi:hypothetical protein